MTLDAILQKVSRYNPRYVTVTGGEPLAQPLCLELLVQLCDKGYEVSLETSGAIDVSQVDQRVIKVVDLKTPASREVARNLYENLDFLFPHDQVKFVICDRSDYEWAKSMMQQYQLNEKCEVLFSPSYEQLANQQLAEWILQDNLAVRFQLQIHKYIWGDIPGV